jgi:hypothetical protein
VCSDPRNSEGIADDVHTVVDHFVEQRLKAGNRIRKWRVVNRHLCPGHRGEDGRDAGEHVGFTGTQRCAAIDVNLANLVQKRGRLAGRCQPVGDVTRLKAAEGQQSNLLTGAEHALRQNLSPDSSRGALHRS